MGNFPDIPNPPGELRPQPPARIPPCWKRGFSRRTCPCLPLPSGPGIIPGRERAAASSGEVLWDGKDGINQDSCSSLPAAGTALARQRDPGLGIPASGSRPHPGSLRLSGSRDLMPASRGCSGLSTGQGFHHGFRNLFPNSSSRLPKPSPRAPLGAGAMGAALPPGIFPRAGILSWRLPVLALKPGLSSRQDLPQLPWE